MLILWKLDQNKSGSFAIYILRNKYKLLVYLLRKELKTFIENIVFKSDSPICIFLNIEHEKNMIYNTFSIDYFVQFINIICLDEHVQWPTMEVNPRTPRICVAA